MECVVCLYLLLTFALISTLVVEFTEGTGLNFDPFMDNHPYVITWGPSLEYNKEEADKLGDRHILVTTNKEERYQCVLPQSSSDSKTGGHNYNGPTATELLQPMLTQKECSYRIESYWTYELCHTKHLRQYHEVKDPAHSKTQEFFLGYGNHRTLEKVDETQEEDPNRALPVKEVDGELLPYYEIIMSDGTKCDLTDEPRKAHVLYVCYKEGRGEVYQLKEVSTCEYEVVVLTGLLCNHPKFKPQPKAVSEIKCYSFIGSPVKPPQLVSNEQEAKFLQAVGQDFVIPETEPVVPTLNDPPGKPMIIRKDPKPPVLPPALPPQTPPAKLGTFTDKQTLRDFFSGQKCLRGGQGWWKHEICYGKHAKQYHIENGKENSIYLGFWNIEKHIEWLKQNPLKRPKDQRFRLHVSQHYSHGDVCDLIGKHRTCEVRLKCIENTKNPHAVMLSLAEPASCQYVLTVDSALFCPIMKNANNDAMFEDLDLS